MSTVVVPTDQFFSYSINYFSHEGDIKHKRRPWWPWTSRWRRCSNGMLLWSVAHAKYNSRNKKVSVRTWVSTVSFWKFEIIDKLAPVQSCASWINSILWYFTIQLFTPLYWVQWSTTTEVRCQLYSYNMLVVQASHILQSQRMWNIGKIITGRGKINYILGEISTWDVFFHHIFHIDWCWEK